MLVGDVDKHGGWGRGRGEEEEGVSALPKISSRSNYYAATRNRDGVTPGYT